MYAAQKLAEWCGLNIKETWVVLANGWINVLGAKFSLGARSSSE